MTAKAIYALQTPVATGDATLTIAQRDALLTGAGGGVKLDLDLAFPWCYPGGAYTGRAAAGAPANAAALYDVSENSNGSVALQAAEVISYAGGGFDFSALTKVGSYAQGGGAAAASIWAAAQQYFLVCSYVKLPTLANWNSSVTLHEMLKFGTTSYSVGPELVTFAQTNSGSGLSVRRQNGAGTADVMPTIVPNALDYGALAQLSFWRDATGQYARLRSANGTVQVSAAVGVNNTQNFSALTFKAGTPPGFAGAAGAAVPAGQTNSVKWRLFRAFVENLNTSGRDANTVLEADWARVVARGDFS